MIVFAVGMWGMFIGAVFNTLLMLVTKAGETATTVAIWETVACFVVTALVTVMWLFFGSKAGAEENDQESETAPDPQNTKLLVVGVIGLAILLVLGLVGLVYVLNNQPSRGPTGPTVPAAAPVVPVISPTVTLAPKISPTLTPTPTRLPTVTPIPIPPTMTPVPTLPTPTATPTLPLGPSPTPKRKS